MSRRKRVVAPERSISIEGGGAIMPIPKGDWSADQSLTVQLTMAESNMLAWLAKRAGVTRAEPISRYELPAPVPQPSRYDEEDGEPDGYSDPSPRRTRWEG